MEAGSVCSRSPVTVAPSLDIASSARVMREKHVGYLVVVEPGPDGGDVPVGVLTDRDIVISVVAREVDARAVRVEDIMARSPLVVGESTSLEDSLRSMREIGVRRVPVIGAHGRLVGVLALDDAIDELSLQLGSIAASIRNEQRFERMLRR